MPSYSWSWKFFHFPDAFFSFFFQRLEDFYHATLSFACLELDKDFLCYLRLLCYCLDFFISPKCRGLQWSNLRYNSRRNYSFPFHRDWQQMIQLGLPGLWHVVNFLRFPQNCQHLQRIGSNLENTTPIFPRDRIDSFGHLLGYGHLSSFKGIFYKLLLVMDKNTEQKRIDSWIPFLKRKRGNTV